MALNEDECGEAYAWLIEQLAGLGADDAVREIETIVRAGTTREEESERRGGVVTVRTALSPRERLVVALRYLLATACVPLMLESASHMVEPSTPPAMFCWLPDKLGDDLPSRARLPGVSDSTGRDEPEVGASFHLGEPEELRELYRAAHRVAAALGEIEADR